mmetsp:Transcript_139184/g.277486  ORF Transcript_139184/g.277486 Transcript_139184/m.277486 type:complete len:205 (+) Transcript_139184:476-1090(+)
MVVRGLNTSACSRFGTCAKNCDDGCSCFCVNCSPKFSCCSGSCGQACDEGHPVADRLASRSITVNVRKASFRVPPQKLMRIPCATLTGLSTMGTPFISTGATHVGRSHSSRGGSHSNSRCCLEMWARNSPSGINLAKSDPFGPQPTDQGLPPCLNAMVLCSKESWSRSTVLLSEQTSAASTSSPNAAQPSTGNRGATRGGIGRV